MVNNYNFYIIIVCWHCLSSNKVKNEYKITKVNLEIAFPNKKDIERKKILKNTYKHYGILLVEFLRLRKIKKNLIHKSN